MAGFVAPPFSLRPVSHGLDSGRRSRSIVECPAAGLVSSLQTRHLLKTAAERSLFLGYSCSVWCISDPPLRICPLIRPMDALSWGRLLETFYATGSTMRRMPGCREERSEGTRERSFQAVEQVGVLAASPSSSSFCRRDPPVLAGPPRALSSTLASLMHREVQDYCYFQITMNRLATAGWCRCCPLHCASSARNS